MSRRDPPDAPQASTEIRTQPTSERGPLGHVDPAGGSPPGAPPRTLSPTGTLTVAIGLAGLIASLVVLGSIAEGVREQEVFALDTWATPFLHGIATPALDALMNGLTTMGSSLVIVPAFVLIMAGLLFTRRSGAALFLTLASGGALVLNASMKLFFERPRPHLAWANVLPDYSFPSGHTMNGVVFYIAIALIVWSIAGRRLGSIALAIAIALALGIGLSRIYLGYHYLTDVVGGLLAGTAWLLVLGAGFRARPTLWPWGDPRSPVDGRRSDARPGPSR
jgi:undecaprenyl-diphosphatase